VTSSETTLAVGSRVFVTGNGLAGTITDIDGSEREVAYDSPETSRVWFHTSDLLPLSESILLREIARLRNVLEGIADPTIRPVIYIEQHEPDMALRACERLAQVALNHSPVQP
jgi:hypothetical protein